MSEVVRYMGDHPVLPCTVDDHRIVDTYDGGRIKNRPATLPVRVQLRWAVAVVTCPYCSKRHEHPMSRSSGWGWYRALCDPNSSYYLTVNQLAAP